MELSRENLELIKEFSESLKSTLALYEEVKAINLKDLLAREVLESELSLEYDEVCAQLINGGLSKQKLSKHPAYKIFKKIGVDIDLTSQPNKLSSKLDNLAKFLIDNSKVLEDIRVSIQNSLKDKTNKVHIELPKGQRRKIIIDFIERMYEIGILEKVEVSQDVHGYLLTINPTTIVKRFFDFTYYERYVRLIISEMLLNNKINFQVLSNLEITLPGGQKQELDIVFVINKSELLWIEVKSHSKLTKENIQKYIFIGRSLKLNETNSFIVLRNSSKDNNERLSSVLPMGVMDGVAINRRLSKFIKGFKNRLEQTNDNPKIKNDSDTQQNKQRGHIMEITKRVVRKRRVK